MKDFLGASIRRDRHRRNRSATVFSIAMVIALIATAFGIIQLHAAAQGQRQVAARSLVTVARALLDSNPRTALQLLETAQYLHSDRETRSALATSLLATPYAGFIVQGNDEISLVGYPADGRILATGGNSGATLWNITDPAAPKAIGSVADPITVDTGESPGRYWTGVNDVAFNADGHILVTAIPSGVTIWDISNLAAPQRLSAPDNRSADDVALTADGHILATASVGGVNMWDISNLAAPQRLRAPDTGPVKDLALTADGHILATASDGGVNMWDISNLAAPQRLNAPDTGPVTGVAFTPDGHMLATSDSTGPLRVWDITDSTRTHQLDSPLGDYTGPVTGVAFAPDGHILATSGKGGVSLWRPKGLSPPQHVGMKRACTITGGGPDKVEWALYVSGLEYVDVCKT